MKSLSRTQGTVIVVLLALAVVLVTVFALIGNGKNSVTVEQDDDVIEVQTLTQPMPVGGDIEHPEFGKQTYFSYGPIAGTPAIPGNGVVYGRMFADGTYFHTINLNIELPPKGSFYQGWLKNEAGEYVKTERLYNRFGDVRYTLAFDAKRDLTAYKTVIVSRESSDSVTVPTMVVAEGTLKEAKQGK